MWESMPFRVLLYLHFLHFLKPLDLAGGCLNHRFVGYNQSEQLLVGRECFIYLIDVAADFFFNLFSIFCSEIIFHIVRLVNDFSTE